MIKYRTVALLGREPGLRVLQDVLLTHPQLDLAAVYTHRLKPRDEGGGERLDYPRFVECCAGAGIPLHALEWGRASRELCAHLPEGPLDLMIALSWRSIIPAAAIERMRLGGINIHRGALPAYAGALPVQRAIEAGETRVAITAHDLAAEIDAGAPLAVGWLDIPQKPADHSAERHAETVKSLLLPFYAPVCRLAIELRIGARGALE